MKHLVTVATASFSALCLYWFIAALRKGFIDIGRGSPILISKQSPWSWAWMVLYVLAIIGAALLAAMIEISK